MGRMIIGTGALFVILLFGLLQYFKHVDITAVSQINITEIFSYYFNFDAGNGLSRYELSVFFSIFVLIQFWNMFNAKAFATGKSAFASLLKSPGFIGVGLLIVVGQLIIVTFGGEMFSVTPLSATDWWQIILATSVVLWVGEILRAIIRLFKKCKR